jgi:hypothetical protein
VNQEADENVDGDAREEVGKEVKGCGEYGRVLDLLEAVGRSASNFYVRMRVENELLEAGEELDGVHDAIG